MLIFDPDTTVESLRTNVAFLRDAPEYPSNFGRVELYAGTPLLARMQAENRVRGDYLQWDYDLGSPEVERIFTLAMDCFMERNFGDNALSNRIMGTRFDVEVARHFHPDKFEAKWLATGKELTSILTLSGADAMEAILNHVEGGGAVEDDKALVVTQSKMLRDVEESIRERAKDLARTLQKAIGQGRPLTDVGDKVATPLQTQRAALSLAVGH